MTRKIDSDYMISFFKRQEEEANQAYEDRVAAIQYARSQQKPLTSRIHEYKRDIAKKRALQAEAQREGLDTTTLDATIADMEIQLEATKTELERCEELSRESRPVQPPRLQGAIEVLHRLPQDVECVEVADPASCFAQLSVEIIETDETGVPRMVRASLGAQCQFNLRLDGIGRRYARKAWPPALSWIRELESSMNPKGMPSAFAFLVPEEGRVFLTVDPADTPGRERKRVSWDSVYGIVYVGEALRQHGFPPADPSRGYGSMHGILSLEPVGEVKVLEERELGGVGELPWDSARFSGSQGSRRVSRRVSRSVRLSEPNVAPAPESLVSAFRDAVGERIDDLTTSDPSLNATSESLPTDDLRERLKEHLAAFQGAPWSRAVKGDLAVFKYLLGEGVRPIVWNEALEGHYGFRVRTRDHDWLLGEIYVEPAGGARDEDNTLIISDSGGSARLGTSYFKVARSHD